MLIHISIAPIRRFKKTVTISFVAILLATAVLNAFAGDLIVEPGISSGFVVRDNTGVTELLRVQDNGQVTLPSVSTASSQSQGVCIGAGGLLGPCSGTIGGVIGGSGTVNYLSKWTPNGATLGNSLIYDNGIGIGIGTTAPVNTFQIGGTPGFSGNHLAIGNGTQAMSFFQSPQSSIWYTDTNFALMPNNGSGKVGIGTTSPTNRLQIGSVANYGGHDIAFGNGVQASAIAQDVSVAWWYSKTNLSLLPVDGIGYVGINTTTPANKLQIGSIGTALFSNNDIAFGNGAQASAIAQTPTVGYWYTNATNIALMPNSGTGFVGIGTTTPASSLQIGSVGTTGYGGDDIAFGDGTQATGIKQFGTYMQVASTTDIALMPRGNGHGRVGINTTTPNFPLEVNDYIGYGPYLYNYFKSGNYAGPILSSCSSCTANVSISASANVIAVEFDALSDTRIKDIVSISDSTKDLDTINGLQITDYRLKDKVRNGDKLFKKVIAQQVETVYPQVVSKHVDFIPNVYQAATSITKIDGGTLLHFQNGHHLSAQAKRIKLLASGDSTMLKTGIISIPSENDVVVDLQQVNGDKIFVYGEEVDDFRTVDYEGLTTLNISATQELSKRLTKQQADFIALDTQKDAQISELRKQLENVANQLKQIREYVIKIE